MHETRGDGLTLNVLIVIEEPKFRHALDAFLRSESVDPDTVASLDEARQIPSMKPYDLIFVSETLNALSLNESYDAIRSLPHAESARVVAVSPSRAPALRSLYEAGFDGVVGPTSTADEIVSQVILAARPQPSVSTPEELQASDERDESDAFDDAEQPEAAGELTASDEREDQEQLGSQFDPAAVEPPVALSDRSRDILATLKTLGFYLSHGARAERQARHALRAVSILFPDAPAAIWLRPDEGRGLVLVPGADLPSEYPEMAHPYYANMSDSHWEELASEPRFIPRERGVTGPLVSLFAVPSIHGALHLGLVTSERTIGLLAVYVATADRPDGHDIIALETIASMAAVAIAHDPADADPADAAALVNEPAGVEPPWREVFEQFPDAAFLIDAQGQFVAANRALSRVAAISSEAMRLLSVYDLLDEADVDVVSDRVTSIVSGESVGPQCLRVGFKREGEYVVPMQLVFRGIPAQAWSGPPLVQGVVRETPLDAPASSHLDALQDIARVVAAERDVETAISGVLHSLALRLGYPRAIVWIVSDDGSELRRRATLTDDAPESVSFDNGVAGRVFRTWQAELETDGDGSWNSGGIACVPIEHGDRILGVLQIEGDASRPLTERDLAFFGPIAAQIAGIIERDSLYRHLEHQAMTDQVTGLPNRQAFQQHLDQTVASLGDGGGVVSALVLGVDGFKEINELYGHAIADEVLRQIGVELRARVEPEHLLARYTSDQFAVLLPGINRDEAVNIAEDLRITVGTHLFTVAEQVEQLTVSIGASTCPDDAQTSQALLQAADHAMYLAKRAGRNQTFQSNAAFATLAPAHGRINDLLRQSPRETLSLLIRAMDQRLPERAGHSERVTRYAQAIAREMGVPDTELPRLRLAAYIHDIGMVSLPDALLRKPSQLSPEERGLLRGVPVAAHGLLSQLDMHESVLLSVLHQRENFDGAGYPSGLRGESIPLGARIIAVADALDAMTSVRAHRQPMTLDQALEQVSQQSGRQFDPAVVQAAYCLTDVISEPVMVSPSADADRADTTSSRELASEMLA